VLHSGFRSCFKSTWGQKSFCLPHPFPLITHRHCQVFH
jgi:hypothetical protein